jgi:hypothetical protein
MTTILSGLSARSVIVGVTAGILLSWLYVHSKSN